MPSKSVFDDKARANLLADVGDEEKARANMLSSEFFQQVNQYHSISVYDDKEIETLLLKQKEHEVSTIGAEPAYDTSLPKFSPSSANSCERELFFKNIKAKKDARTMFPYQRRWVDNGSAIHERSQRDLLYMEKELASPKFRVARTKDGLPAWEKNIKTHHVFLHNGAEFVMTGMSDGILVYVPENTYIGYEFKTKSTTLGAVGHYKLKKPQDAHIAQQVGYSLLFNIDEFLIHYESLAKPNWGAGDDAKTDIRVFYLKVTEEDRQKLLDKFARVAKHVKEETVPPAELDKCIFCEYKETCKLIGGAKKWVTT